MPPCRPENIIILPTMAATATNGRTRAAAPNNNDLHRHQQPHPPGVVTALSPPPFSARSEREELERLLPSSAPPPPLTTTSPTTVVAMMPRNTMIAPTTAAAFVPTAVPIDDFTSGITTNDDDVAVVAIASPFHPVTAASAAAAAPALFTTSSTTRTDLNGNFTTTSTAFTSIRSSPKADYGKDIDADADNIVVLPEEVLPTTATPITLPAIPLPTTSSSPPPRTNLRAANVMGTMSSEYEIADVARAQRKVRQVLQEQNELAVQLANVKAAVAREGGDDEGLTVDGRIHHMYCDESNNNVEAWKRAQLKKDEEKVEDEDVTPYGNAQRNGKRGYEVQPYDVSEYDPKGHEYDVSEYKSVYD